MMEMRDLLQPMHYCFLTALLFIIRLTLHYQILIIQTIMFRFHVNIMFNQIPCGFMNNENWRRVVDNLHYTCTEVMIERPKRY